MDCLDGVFGRLYVVFEVSWVLVIVFYFRAVSWSLVLEIVKALI